MLRKQNQGRIGFALLVFTLCASLAAQQAERSTQELPAGEMQAKATTSCLECHEARIILQQRLSKAAWTREVDKMMRWGALVEASDRDALIDYLSVNFGPDKPPYQAPRSSREDTGSRSSGK